MERNNYRAAVCLNNYGASLLERGQYRESAIVLRDSLTIMNGVLQQAQGRESCNNNNTENVCVADKLHFATKCMAESTLLQRKNKAKRSYVADVHVFRYDGGVSLDESLSHCTNAITIDDFDTHKEVENVRADMDIHTAIIVYNTAMARLAAVEATKSRKRTVVVKACIKLLRWAQAILSQRALEHRPREATQLSVLILGKLVHLLQMSGEKMEAIKASRARQSMKNTFDAYENLVPSRPDLAAAA